MKKELTLRWTKTKPLTRQGRGKEEETASVASLFVLFKFKPLSKNGEYYIGRNVLDKEHGRHGIGSCGRHLLRLDLSAAQQRGYKREDGKKFIFHLLWALFFNSPEAQIIIEIFRILFQKIQLGESLPRCVF